MPAKKYNPASARRLAGGTLVLVVLYLSLTRMRDADVWWHLKTGQLILESGIPRTDPFSYVIGGHSWVDFEWLSQALFFLLFRLGGPAALTGFKAALLAGSFFLLWRLNPERPVWGCVVLSAAALAAREHFVERPFIFDLFFLAALAAAFWNARFREPPRHLWWSLPLGTALWANLHGGAAVLAPGLVALGAAAHRLGDEEVPVGRWAALVGLGIVGLLANPNGAGILIHLWRTLSFPGKELIREWHAPIRQFLGLYGLSLAAGLPACWREFKRRPLAVAWVLAAAAASMSMERNVPLYLLLAAPLIVSSYMPRQLVSPRPPALAAVLLCVAAAAWAHTAFAVPYLRARIGIGTEEPLAGAAAFLDEAGIEGRMFNEYESGGYLLWKGYPRRKVFIDGRNMEYGPRLLRLALAWYRPEAWAVLDGTWGFDYAVISRHVTGAYTARVLEESPQWAAVYWDDSAMVYLRRTPAHEDLLRRYGYRLLRPGRSLYQYLESHLQEPSGARALLEEIERSLSQARGPCVNALLMKAYVLVRMRRWEEAAAAGRKATEFYPDRAQPWFTLGWIYETSGDLARAQEAYEASLSRVAWEERGGLGADVLNNLGRVRERRGDLEGARQSYRKSLRWNPGQGDALRNSRRLG